jgi:hypothetical protein
MKALERALQYLEKKKAQRRLLRELDEAPSGPFPLETKGEATKTIENLSSRINQATEEKRKARTTAQRIIDLLKE